MRHLQIDLTDEAQKRIDAMMERTSLKSTREIFTAALVLFDQLVDLVADGRQIWAVKRDDPIAITAIELGFKVKPKESA